MAGAKHILATGKDGTFCLNHKNLESILFPDDVLDKPVVVISVAGAFRKGKSFLLDMMLRYLEAPDKTNWIDEKRCRGSGFPWQGGYRRHTTGILMWSKPIPVTLPSGEEAVVLLMDTQGTFDNQSTVHESATVFALSTLLSSLQIFNLMGNVQNDDLEHLQLFTEYGRLAMEDSDTKPFQKLLFLVRDWQFIDDLALGARGGDELVREWLRNKSGKAELERVRKHISDCFTEITGFLLPHPGQTVASSAKFDGCANDMDPKFADGLKELMPMLLSPERLTIKTIAGNTVKARDLVNYMEMYVSLFKSGKIPKPKNILQVTAEANNMAAVQEAKSQYIKDMQSLLGADGPSLDENELFKHHNEAARKAEKAFKSHKKMGDWKVSEEYHTRLVLEMEEWFGYVEQANKMKRETEMLNAEKHNAVLVDTCKQTYTQEMQEVAGEEVAHVPSQQLENAHIEAKQKAMSQYDAEKVELGNAATESRFRLVEVIDAELRQMVFHNNVKKDASNQRFARTNMDAVRQSKECYQSMMNTLTLNEVLSDERLREGHQQALTAALDMFETLKAGDEDMCAGYFETLKCDLDRDLSGYVRANVHKTQMAAINARVVALQNQVLQSQRTNTRKCNIL
ncbi:atlastin-1-like [Pollicipes pollicipes]|uniref:atlastin-1-like n=1 Tax=Pollicipes pollicipes TaxID=41117 RepID=UPI0018850753|nr:atlastin-1-like [Pollicipes pollicipes]XP_037072066.1 atlastin-1-like [Pollicipes pollicipes]